MYRKLKIWKNSITLIKNIYIFAEKLPKSEDFNLKAQLRRAAVSVALNIAEGKCRTSAKEFSHFLNTASASLSEVEAIIYICQELCYVNDVDLLINETQSLNRQINSLRNKLKENINE